MSVQISKLVPSIRHCGVLFFLCLLVGCASNRLKTIDPNKTIPLSELNHWQLKARIAIKTPEDNVTASLDWQQDSGLFDFLLSGSFGITLAHLIQEKDQATLQLPDTEKQFHHDAEHLLQRNLGWNFPIKALSYWVKGLPSGDTGENLSYDENGNLSSLVYGDWQVTFSKYKRYQGQWLPKMIKATHPQYRLKIVATKWAFFE